MDFYTSSKPAAEKNRAWPDCWEQGFGKTGEQTRGRILRLKRGAQVRNPAWPVRATSIPPSSHPPGHQVLFDSHS